MVEAAGCMGELDSVRQQVSKCRVELGALRLSAEEIERYAVDVLMENDVSFMDESDDATGPFWVLAKSGSTPPLTNTRSLLFFRRLLPRIIGSIGTEHQMTAEECTEELVAYRHTYQQRRVVLRKVQVCRPTPVRELQAWLDAGAEVV
jgi:hypothetical protein